MSVFRALVNLAFVYLMVYKIVTSEHVQPRSFTNTWAIRTDSEESAKQIARRHDFLYRGKIGGLKGYYLLEKKAVPKRRRRSTDHHTRTLFADPAIHWSQQQRILKRVKRGFKDPLFREQWYLENVGQAYGPSGYDINVLPVWNKKITGRGVVVTILDDGIEYTHPDLKRNYDTQASYDYNSYDNDPSPRYTDRGTNKHGTRCAGEVAADINDVCGVGVAYNAKVGGIRMLDGDVTDGVEAASLSHAIGHVDIYSSSWGPEDKGAKVDGPAVLAKRALRDGVRKGRKGLGSIFVWATGNGGDYDDYCNCDGYITSIYTISIGAVNDEGKSPWYAEPCPSTLAVSYSSGRKNGDSNKKIATTDLHHMCTKSHTGTSAAAPIAAGIFALVLEANPRLTWRDLQHLIVNTSRVTDAKDPGWQTNSAGYHVNNKYGFGLLDADALVTQAMSPHWATAREQHMCREVEHVDNTRIPANGRFTTSIFSNACINANSCVTELEHVAVYVSLQHDRRGTLEINLISPSGTKSKLLGLRKFDSSDAGFNNWPFMTVFHWGENPHGTWTLQVESKGAFSGTFKRWALRMFGTCEHTKNKTLNENQVCDKHCKKGCPQPFSKVCVDCVKYCDCTTGRCTSRCRKDQETDSFRKQCRHSSNRTVPDDNIYKPASGIDVQKTPTRNKSLPGYGRWLLVAAGVAVTFGVVAGAWQGWLYYKTRKKLMRARNQEEMSEVHQYANGKVTRNVIVRDVEQIALTAT